MSAFSLHLSPLMSSGAAYAKVPKASSLCYVGRMYHMRQPHVRHLRCSLPAGIPAHAITWLVHHAKLCGLPCQVSKTLDALND